MRLTVIVAVLATAALACAACVRPTIAARSTDECAAAATPDALGQCMLAEATRLEAQLADETARLVSVLESGTHERSFDDTGTGHSLIEEFQRAQQAWQQYKDAQCSYAYATALGGELRGLNAATCLRDVLRERVERVRAERERLEGRR